MKHWEKYIAVINDVCVALLKRRSPQMSACMTLVCLALLFMLLGFDSPGLHDHSNKQF